MESIAVFLRKHCFTNNQQRFEIQLPIFVRLIADLPHNCSPLHAQFSSYNVRRFPLAECGDSADRSVPLAVNLSSSKSQRYAQGRRDRPLPPSAGPGPAPVAGNSRPRSKEYTADTRRHDKSARQRRPIVWSGYLREPIPCAGHHPVRRSRAVPRRPHAGLVTNEQVRCRVMVGRAPLQVHQPTGLPAPDRTLLTRSPRRPPLGRTRPIEPGPFCIRELAAYRLRDYHHTPNPAQLTLLLTSAAAELPAGVFLDTATMVTASGLAAYGAEGRGDRGDIPVRLRPQTTSGRPVGSRSAFRNRHRVL